MACKKTSVPFRGTKEQEEQLRQIVAELKDQPGSLMPIMQKAQEIYGYLPIEVQTMISEWTGIPMEKIYGVATFYAQFAWLPRASTASPCASAQPATSRALRASMTRSPRFSASAKANALRTASSLWTPAAASAPAVLRPL